MAKRAPSDINLLFAVDKPAGCTSHDVVGKARRALGVRRIGHAGTLDPLATGVMLLGVGQATRLLGMLTLDQKSYIATISFGTETNTDDAEGEVTRTAVWDESLAEPARAQEVLNGFLGPQMQVPPAFSAISVNGVRAYKSARAGEEIELPARPVEVLAAQLLTCDALDGELIWNVAFTVSKGTYIRSLARDIGRSVNSAAHISGLRRTSSGAVNLVDAIKVEELQKESIREHMLDPLQLLDIPAVELPESVLASILNGQRVKMSGDVCDIDSPEFFGLVVSGQLRAIALAEKGYYVMRDVFPQGIEGVR